MLIESMYSVCVCFEKSYFNFETMKLLGPLTSKPLNDAVNSGPRLNWILSKPNGSSGTVFTSPKSPVANRCRNPLITVRIHSLGFGAFREQVFIAEARLWKRKNLNENYAKSIVCHKKNIESKWQRILKT